MKTIAVIGGGAAGMMAAISASENNNDAKVMLFEKNEKLGKKLYITGKGRCNLTNLSDVEDILTNVPTNPYFLYSSLYSLDSWALVNFFNESNLATKVERGNRVFPNSDKSSDVINALKFRLDKSGVDIHLNATVESLIISGGVVKGVRIKGKGTFYADACIIATGGLSYPKTGSSGDGFKFAKDSGHNIVKCYPSLVGLLTDDCDLYGLQGLTLKNVGVSVLSGNRMMYSGFGEVLFTHNGISGPVILTASRFITKEMETGADIAVNVDLKPALTLKELDLRLQRDFLENKNKNFDNSLSGLLPQKMIQVIIKKSGIDQYKKVNEVTKSERNDLLTLLKKFPVRISGTEGFDHAVITCGGVDVVEINPSTMESKLVKGLYFAGEIMDVDAFTGGYNLQIAFSTGYLAGKNL